MANKKFALVISLGMEIIIRIIPIIVVVIIRLPGADGVFLERWMRLRPCRA